MSISKKSIHTTLSKECRDWLLKESTQTGNYEGKIIETAIDFYRNNKSLLEEYEHARIFLKELVKTELLDEYAKARPLLKRLIKEEFTDHGFQSLF